MVTLVLDLGHTNITQQQMQYILTEDYGYFSARTWEYQYNTTTNAIHTLLDVFSGLTASYVPSAGKFIATAVQHVPAGGSYFLFVEVHMTLVTSCS